MARRQKRTDPERHRQQMRAADRARHRAENDLVAMYRDEFDEIYQRTAAEEGVAAYGPKQRLNLTPEQYRARRTQQKRESRARLRAERAEDGE